MAQYRQNETEISLSMLLEVVDALKGYGTDLVIVGGRAPYLLLQKFGAKDAEEHVGSLDGDLALNFRRIPEEKYETILETLARIGYAQRTNAAGKPIPASFQKTINVGEVPFTMQIDFLAGEYGGTASRTVTRRSRTCWRTRAVVPVWYLTISTPTNFRPAS